MLTLRHPSPELVRRYLDALASRAPTHPHVGATQLPYAEMLRRIGRRYALDHRRMRLGSGADCFERACQALESWQMFAVPGVELVDPATPIEVGRCVAVLARALGLYSLNPCRIVARIDPGRDLHRKGFAYSTLPGHVATGEERFLVEWSERDDAVWYDLLAFSRPAGLLPRLAHPYMRRRQADFARASLLAMRAAVAGPGDSG